MYYNPICITLCISMYIFTNTPGQKAQVGTLHRVGVRHIECILLPGVTPTIRVIIMSVRALKARSKGRLTLLLWLNDVSSTRIKYTLFIAVILIIQ